jgi:hypothetical protein
VLGDDDMDGSVNFIVEGNVSIDHASHDNVNTSFYTLDNIVAIMTDRSDRIA